MFTIRKLVCRPRVDDWAPLAKFYYADEALSAVTNELDSFDSRNDPDRCQQLISRLRQCQERVLQIIEEMMGDVFPDEADRAPRDFRVKFPDDLLHENLPGQLWFGAECLAAGSNIIEREFESELIRPLAKGLIQNLDTLREALKQQSLKNATVYPERLRRLLRQFDSLFAEFELNYVSAMVPVKSIKEYEMQLDVAVLFSETLERAMQHGYLTQAMIDDCDPSIMITLPRLAIVCGLLVFTDGPLCVDKPADQLPEVFRSFRSLLQKIRDLLKTFTDDELTTLERALSSQEDASTFVEKSDVTLISEYRNSRNKPKKNFVPPLLDASSIVESDANSKQKKSSPSASSSSTTNSDDQQPKYDDEEADKLDSLSAHSSSTTLSSNSNDASDVCVRITVDDKNSGDSEDPSVQITYSNLPSQSTSRDEDCATDDDAASEQMRNQMLRSRFRSSGDLVHRLFVCIAGVADQWQSNYPSDLRAVLKMVLHPEEVVNVYEINGKPARGTGREEEVGVEVGDHSALANTGVVWVPDSECTACTACQAQFTFVRRRHHCRNCGQIFCSRCSQNSATLPQYGYTKPVRVCNQCFLFKLMPFTSVPTSRNREPTGESQVR